ncbi:hypothetical protein [Yinghuangia soli]|uniref:Uncharacterized protein n=1 Tax=Yinghuangia soli TaxID=2908204 RepID=A0AA41Q1B0_9ACTN|nr:hypothetical protein [Yinghuangia soli]MCF2528624.1 hypothetical protein [Yinghuangia soli]
MLEYEMFQARAQELHAAAAQERRVRFALRNRREARRQERAAAGASSRVSSSGGIAGSVRPAM